MDLGQILSYQHLALIIAIMGVLQAVKATLDKIKWLNRIPTQLIMPYLPMVMGAVASFIPGVIQANEVGLRAILGVACGALSGQVWKVVKTNVDVLKGKP